MRPTRHVLGDIALAAALAVVGLVGTAGADLLRASDTRIDGTGYALVVAAATALVGRRRWALATLAVVTALTTTYLVLGYPYGPITVSFLIAVYTAARHLPFSRSVPASVAALAVFLTHLFTHGAALPGFLGVVPGSAWVVVPFAIGVIVRLAQESAARARADAVRQRVDQERLRVAQEVHDVVGHGLAAIKVQADVALHLMAKNPEQAEVALSAISRTSTEALDELRATLAVIPRGRGGSGGAAAPGLDRVPDLCQRMRDAGVRVQLTTSGASRTLPPNVDLAGYRVVQEALTNVLRHSADKVATVRIDYQTEAVALAITNPLGSVPVGSAGLGISGMRERVLSLGGDFAAGPSSGGRFEVRARLPTGSPT